ncbi:unnamed protein product [Angiostrongylus costaricensis]|uniref:Ras-related protein Rab-26 n=1 Tax=Angiostrongylus costaricensis TaxID=334426 RepID=A0A158PFG4_ANGCS|nr:unnamed protein product [Angiostrongylus costaricensis]
MSRAAFSNKKRCSLEHARILFPLLQVLFTALERHRIIINELVYYPFYEVLKKNLVTTKSRPEGLTVNAERQECVEHEHPISRIKATAIAIILVMLLGDSCTGKTCLLVRYKDGAFLSNNFISTVGIDYRNKVIDIDSKKIKLQIWDTAGQERFRSVTTAYYREADALLLVFDVSNRTSFENVRSWLSQVREHGKESVQVTLVGNKCDLGSARTVKPDEARQLASALSNSKPNFSLPSTLLHDSGFKNNEDHDVGQHPFINALFKYRQEKIVPKLSMWLWKRKRGTVAMDHILEKKHYTDPIKISLLPVFDLCTVLLVCQIKVHLNTI